MEKINVQLLFTKEEYTALEEEANRYGLTVPLYIKSEVLQNDPFSFYYKKLIQKVDALPQGTKFTIKSLFGVEWTMSKGIKLNLGKTYFNRVLEGIVKNVDILGKDSSNLMWYQKQ